MSYIKHVLQPNEKILIVGRISWVVYHRAIICLIVGLALVWLAYSTGQAAWRDTALSGAALFGLLALASAFHAWFIRWTTEIAVTDKRIIFKRGFINRHTVEMNMDKVATVDVDQGILGRVFDYGSIRIVGTGGTPGIEKLNRVAAPLAVRTAIEVR